VKYSSWFTVASAQCLWAYVGDWKAEKTQLAKFWSDYSRTDRSKRQSSTLWGT